MWKHTKEHSELSQEDSLSNARTQTNNLSFPTLSVDEEYWYHPIQVRLTKQQVKQTTTSNKFFENVQSAVI